VSFTIDDFQDLLRLLEQRPEWRADLRRHVLTEELLALPALVRELADGQAALTRQVEALAAAQARTEVQVGALADRVGTLADRVGALADRVGVLVGDMLELRYARRAPAYFARLARRLRTVEPAELADLLDEAVEAARIDEAEGGDLVLADLVLGGRRREDGTEVYVLAEVSTDVGPDDVRRAADRAVILAKLGRPVVPVVAGRSITAEAAALARSRGVWQVLDGKADPPGQR
jgi:hypothetical protein